MCFCFALVSARARLFFISLSLWILAAGLKKRNRHVIVAMRYQQGGFYWYLLLKDNKYTWHVSVADELPKIPGIDKAIHLFYGDYLLQGPTDDLGNWVDPRYGERYVQQRFISNV